MREIKFRVLGKTGDKVWTVYGIPGCFHYCETAMDLMDWETLGQFTGLKDRNDVDIYEGDIVRYIEVTRGSTGEQESRRTTEVKLILDTNTGSFYLYPRVNNSTEVVGNIYENPDLLTKENK